MTHTLCSKDGQMVDNGYECCSLRNSTRKMENILVNKIWALLSRDVSILITYGFPFPVTVDVLSSFPYAVSLKASFFLMF